MRLTKKKTRVVADALAAWRDGGTLSPADAERLLATIETARFDWRRLAKYSFWIAIACIVIAVGAVLADKALLRFLMRLVTLSAFVRCIGLALLAALLYAVSFHRKAAHPEKLYSNEAFCFLGVLATAGAVESLGEALASGSGRFSVLFLLAALLYAVIGLAFPSTLVWVFALLSFASWIGFETGYASGWGAYFLGMNYPLRFLGVGVVLVAASHFFLPWRARKQFWKPTFVVGLLFVFMSLWIMSIFGNYGDLHSWHRAGYGELWWWCVAFAGASGLAIWYGLKRDERAAIGFGITFLFINLYTRFFEHFWNPLHKAVFFALLGLSFWFIGSRAETIWTLGGLVSRDPNHDGAHAARA
jgi:hypothetical protein